MAATVAVADRLPLFGAAIWLAPYGLVLLSLIDAMRTLHRQYDAAREQGLPDARAWRLTLLDLLRRPHPVPEVEVARKRVRRLLLLQVGLLLALFPIALLLLLA